MKVEERLSRFKEESYKDAIRLFRDAAFLYTKDSYPTAFAIAVAAYEEIGKVHVIDRGCDMMCMNPEGAGQLYDMYFKSSWTTNHAHKQRQALFDANRIVPSKDDLIWKYVGSGGLEQTRQQALYVELAGTKVETPKRVTRQKVFVLLRQCYDAFKGTGDLAFNGFSADSNSKSEWQAERAMKDINNAFDLCLAHNKRFQGDAKKRRA